MPLIYQLHDRRDALEHEFRAIALQLDALTRKLSGLEGDTIVNLIRTPVDTFDHPGNAMLAMATSLGT